MYVSPKIHWHADVVYLGLCLCTETLKIDIQKSPEVCNIIFWIWIWGNFTERILYTIVTLLCVIFAFVLAELESRFFTLTRCISVFELYFKKQITHAVPVPVIFLVFLSPHVASETNSDNSDFFQYILTFAIVNIPILILNIIYI